MFFSSCPSWFIIFYLLIPLCVFAVDFHSPSQGCYLILLLMEVVVRLYNYLHFKSFSSLSIYWFSSSNSMSATIGWAFRRTFLFFGDAFMSLCISLNIS